MVPPTYAEVDVVHLRDRLPVDVQSRLLARRQRTFVDTTQTMRRYLSVDISHRDGGGVIFLMMEQVRDRENAPPPHENSSKLEPFD